MGDMGKLVESELKNSDIRILYGIDDNAELIDAEFEVYHLDPDLAIVDAVIVTEIFKFEHTKVLLEQFFTCPILSLEDMVYEIELL